MNSPEKQLKYSIRKVSVGAASVVIGALYLLMGAGVAHAEGVDSAREAERTANPTDTERSGDGETGNKADLDNTDAATTYSAPATENPLVAPEAAKPRPRRALADRETGDAPADGTANTSTGTETPTGETSTGNNGALDSTVIERKGATVKPGQPGVTVAENGTHDPSAHLSFDDPDHTATVEDMWKIIQNMPDDFQNNERSYLRNMDTLGDELRFDKNGNVTDDPSGVKLQPGEIREISSFGGWTAIMKKDGTTGKFAIGMKNEQGYFTGWYTGKDGKRHEGGMVGSEALDQIYVEEQALDRRFKYMLMLAKGRTIANKDDKAQDGSLFNIKTANRDETAAALAHMPVKEREDILQHAPNVEGFNGIEKTFKAFSTKYGSRLKIDFVTGYISDFEGSKGTYRIVVKAIKKDNSEETVYDHTINRIDGVVENEERYAQGVNLKAVNAVIKNILKDEYNGRVKELAKERYIKENPGTGTKPALSRYKPLIPTIEKELAEKGDVTVELPIDKEKLKEGTGARKNKFNEDLNITATTYAYVANTLNTELKKMPDSEVRKNSPIWDKAADPKSKDPDRVYKLLDFILPTAKKIVYHVDTDQLELVTDPAKVTKHREELKKRLADKKAALTTAEESKKADLNKEISALESAIKSTNDYTYTEARNGSKEAHILGSHMEATVKPSTTVVSETEYNKYHTNELAAREKDGLAKFTTLFVERNNVTRTDVLPDDKLSEKITTAIGGDQDKLGKGGYFSTGDIPLGKDVVSYKVQVFAENEKRVGVNKQSPRLQYNLPILADFSVIQDTVEPSKEVARRIITKLKEKGKITEEQEKKIKEEIEKSKKTSELKSAMSGDVKVKYQAVDGTVLTLDNTKEHQKETDLGKKDTDETYLAQKDQLLGTDYDVTSKKLETLTTTGGKRYRLKRSLEDNSVEDGRLRTSASDTGTITLGARTVTYVYEEYTAPPTGKGLVHFKKQVSETTTEALNGYPDISLEGDVGTDFSADSVNAKITELKNAGYEIVTNEFDTKSKTIDSTADVDGQDPSQVYNVTVREKVVTVTTPPTPDTPVDPTVPDGPKWPETGLAKSDLEKEVTRTITYVKKETADGPEIENAKPTKEQTAHFKRSATYNLVTKVVTPGGEWTSTDNTLTAVPTEKLEGYIADRASVEEVTVPDTSGNITEKVVYTKLGSWVPNLPAGETPIDPIPYPNHPTDPTKPGDPTPGVIPHVPGYTPKIGETPLEPKVPGDPSQGYTPPKPSEPKSNTAVTYEPDPQKALVKVINTTTGVEVHLPAEDVNLEGKTAEKISTKEVLAKIADLEKRGFVVDNKDEVVAEIMKSSFDKQKDEEGKDPSQVFTLKVHEKVVPVTPPTDDKPITPGTPIDPAVPVVPNTPVDPKIPVWTEDLINKVKNAETKKEVTRTINYVDESGAKLTYTDNGKETNESKTDKVTFTREAKINVVTGEITYGKWTAKDNDTTFAEVTSPVVKGYILKSNQDSQGNLVSTDGTRVVASENLTATSENQNLKVVYTKLGSWVPKVPGVETPTPLPYPNHPTDPTKPKDPEYPQPGTPVEPNTPVVPYVPGYTPKTPDGNPLVPVDPEHPENGYKVPPVPTTPGNDTPITYEADTQKAIVKYVVEGTTTVLHKDELTGDSGTTINYTTANKLAELKVLGYELVTDGFTTATDKNFDKDKTVDQTFEVTVKPKVVDVPPFEPTNPKGNDNPKPEPEQPIDPENPNGPKWTKALIDKLETTKHITRTITYVEDGTDKEVANKATDKVTFTRSLKVNVVTGDVVDPNVDWTSNDTTFDEVTSPVVKGYILKADQGSEDGLVTVGGTRVAASENLTATSENQNLKVVYTKLGSWVPKVPGVETPTPLPYPNHPTDPTKPKYPEYPQPGTPVEPNTPVIPYVPGYTPKTPDGNPLVPVDPNHPENGYKVPPVPTTPGNDTPIEYSKDPQKAIVKYVVEGTTTVLHKEELTGDSGTTINYTTANKLAELKVLGYELVTDGFTTETGRNFDKDKTVDQTFEVIVKPKVVDVPPFEPTNPKGNDNPKPEPGQPIDPENPNGPKWTKALIDKLETTKHVTRTITYVEDGTDKEVANKATDKVTFTRSLKVNVVTGDVVDPNVDWTSNDTTFDEVTSPVVKGYILKADQGSEDGLVTVGGTRVAASENLKATSENQNLKVVYTKLGSWVPKVPGVETPTPLPYPNHPTDPTKPKYPEYPQPGTPTDPNTPKPPVIPYVPGYTPKTPNGNPLVPVDPEHPENGYKVPPVPTTPGNDTPITYEKVPDKPKPETTGTKEVTRTIKYVDEKGNELAKPSTDKVTFTRNGSDWNAVDGDSTFDAVKSPVVKGYILKDSAQKVVEKETVKSDAKDETITVVYTKVGSYVPKVPEGVTPPSPTPYDNDPQDPSKVVTPNPEKPQDPNDPNGPKVPVIPYVPGYTPKTPDGNPLVPVDPNHPENGYKVPPVPPEPGKDTPITYVKDGQQKAITSFVDPKGNVLETPITETGDSNTPLTKDGEIKATIAKLKLKGYDVETNTYPPKGMFDNDPKVDQYYKVTLVPHVEPVKPFDPTQPKNEDNPKPEPGKPIDPNNPEGPKWTEELINKLETTKQVTRTINYVDEVGNKVSEPSTDKVTFTREAKINVVTGEITYGDWKAVGGDSTFDKVSSPVVKGYILKDPAQKEVAERKGITPTVANQMIEVVYKKLGSWIPKVPGVETPTPLPYPNHPTDPTKPGEPTDPNTPNVPVIPYVPGYTPKIGETPLQPKVPNDPTKGYIPPVPTEPGKDTPIEYVKVPNTPSPEEPVKPTPESNHITIWVDENGKPLKPEQPGTHEAGNIPGYRFITTTTKDGVTIHRFEKISPVEPNNPVPQKPTTPIPTPQDPTIPTPESQIPTPNTPEANTPTSETSRREELPNTGTEANASLVSAGIMTLLAGLGLGFFKKKEDEK